MDGGGHEMTALLTATQHGLFGESKTVTQPLARKKPSVTCRLVPHPVITWSYGGGTQTLAIAILIALGKLPKPDLIVMADTGDEATETWEYTITHVLPLFDALGLVLEI